MAHSVRVLSIYEGKAWRLEQLVAVAAAGRRLLVHILVGREGKRGLAVGLGFSSRFSPNNPVSSFRLYLLKVSKSLKYVCDCLPVEAREGNTFPAARTSDVHADKR